MTASRQLLRRLALSANPQPTLSTRPFGFLPLLSQLLASSSASKTLIAPCALRTYATAKGGRASKTSTKTTTKKKPAAKKTKAPAKKKPKAKKKPAKKPAAKKRTVKKKTDAQLIAEKVRALRKIALLDEPKRRPTTVWTLYNQEHLRKLDAGQKLGEVVRQNARGYRNLSTSERESINQTAINNRALNLKQHTDWVRSHTPEQIRLANNARMRLNRLSKQRHEGSKARYTKRLSTLRDDRQLKRPTTAIMQYMGDRWASGEFAGYKIADASRQITNEWRSMSDADKQKYIDQANTRKEQYLTESAELYPSMAEKRAKEASRKPRKPRS